MEEDIVYLQEVIDFATLPNTHCLIEEKEIKAIRNLLTRYKQLEEENKNTMPIKLVLDMIDDLDKRRDIQKDIEPITGYWSKRAMLKKILKQAGFDYSKYKKEKEI